MVFSWSYFVFMLPCFIISLICNISVKSNFSKYSQISNSRGLTGVQAAMNVLKANSVSGVRFERVRGSMTDHFDPRNNVIRLSEPVYGAATVAAVGVACHEAGHACQHAEGYFPNKLRSAIVPVANIGSRLSWIFLIVGMLLPVQYKFVITIPLCSNDWSCSRSFRSAHVSSSPAQAKSLKTTPRMDISVESIKGPSRGTSPGVPI